MTESGADFILSAQCIWFVPVNSSHYSHFSDLVDVYNRQLHRHGHCATHCSTIATGLRFYLRLKVTCKPIAVDDWLILFSTVLVWGHGTAQVLGKLSRNQLDHSSILPTSDMSSWAGLNISSHRI